MNSWRGTTISRNLTGRKGGGFLPCFIDSNLHFCSSAWLLMWQRKCYERNSTWEVLSTNKRETANTSWRKKAFLLSNETMTQLVQLSLVASLTRVLLPQKSGHKSILWMTGQKSHQDTHLTTAVNIRGSLSNTVKIKTSLYYQSAWET